jgi:outer membrane lipoprotein carrier protein
MPRPLTSVLFVLLLFAAQDLLGAAENKMEYPDDIADRLQSRYDVLHSLSFNFFQDIRGEMTGKPRQGSGQAFFLKKDGKARMRWNYQSPDKQVLISDGTTFSMYFANLNQQLITPAAQLDTDLTYAFFTGRGIIKRDFHVRPADEEEQSTDETEYKVIKLIPKTPHAQVQHIHLFVGTNSLIRRMKIQDHFGTLTVLNLSDIETDPLKSKSGAEIDQLFSFTPPPGTEIIKN